MLQSAAWRMLVVAVAAARWAAAQDFNFTYDYTIPAANNLILSPSIKSIGENWTGGPWVSMFDPQGDRMVCNWTTAGSPDCGNANMQFSFGGTGFCMNGDFGASSARVAINPPDDANRAAWQKLPGDGKKSCVNGVGLAYTKYWISGIDAIENVTFKLASNVPSGYAESDLALKTTPFVLDGQANKDSMFKYAAAPAPVVYTADGVDSLHFDYTAGVIQINTPPNAAFMVLNGAWGYGLARIGVTSSPDLPYPLSARPFFGGYRMWSVQDKPMVILSLDSAVTYQIALSINNYPRSGGLNLTSVTFGQFVKGNGSTPTTSTTGADGGQTGAGTPKSASHTGAIAGGVVGGVLGLVALAVLIWFLCHRRKSQNSRSDKMLVDEDVAHVVEPYDQNQTSLAPSTSQPPQPAGLTPLQSKETESMLSHTTMSQPTVSQTTASSRPDKSSIEGYPAPASSRLSTPMTLLSPTETSAQSGWSVSGSSNVPIHEEDVGSLVPVSAQERLPPMYNPAWRGEAGETRE